MRRNILITGASSGLGEGMAREFAAQGRKILQVSNADELRIDRHGAQRGVGRRFMQRHLVDWKKLQHALAR